MAVVDDDDDATDEDSDLIPESAALPPLTAVAEYERLRSTTLADARVGLLHGRMPLPEKQAVMDAFRAGEIWTCSSRRPSSRSASTCRTPP